MDIIGNLLYSILPADVTHNVWFILAVVLVYAMFSCLQSFVKDPRYGWLAKYDDPIQTILGVLGIWQKKSYSLMTQAGKGGPTTTLSDGGKAMGPDK